ncbi:MAG TPA: DUF1905 domain-containing protein [Cyclobacteriaceae bacterium]|nr:DUF1905 domain-containing protein [Cyclobacteriaceae bacterium]
MAFSFKAKIYKVEINPCVKVPRRITDTMKPQKGYIPIKGKIQNHPFKQTLVPVKGESYRLFVNDPMLKGAKVALGETVHFSIEQNFASRKREFPLLKSFKDVLSTHNLLSVFKKLALSRQKEILKYLSYLKSEVSRTRNINKVIEQLRKNNPKTSIP